MPPPRVLRHKWGAYVLTAAAVAAAIALTRKQLAFLLDPGLLAVATADQRLLLLRFSSVAKPQNQLVLERKADLPGFGSPAFTTKRLWLSPDETLAAVLQVEFTLDAYDTRVTLYATPNAAALFSRTDNSRPDVVIDADHPAAPPLLKKIQAADDQIWAEEKQTNPAAVRMVTTAQFLDTPDTSTLDAIAWTADGKLLVLGGCPMITDTGIELEIVKWWGLAGPSGSTGAWDYLDRGIGAPPAAIALLPFASRKRAVALGPKLPGSDGSALTVDGVTQGLKHLSAGVIAFDGPFKA